MTCPKCNGELRYVLNESRTQILGVACNACEWRETKPEATTWSKPVQPGSRWQYVVYDKPHDMPTRVVVRGFVVPPGANEAYPTNWFMTYDSVEAARAELGQGDMLRVPRQPEDDPVIVETWI